MIDIDIRIALKHPGDIFSFEYEGFPDMPEISFGEPVRLHAEYYCTGDSVDVRGHLQTVLNLQCTRCLDEIKCNVEVVFVEVFLQRGAANGDDNYTYTGETVDLDKLVYDVVMLETPQQLLCKQDCHGLCPQCGINLNRDKCGCETQSTDHENNPFIKLKEFF